MSEHRDLVPYREPGSFEQQALRHYHEPVNPHESNHRGFNFLMTCCVFVLLGLVVWGIYNNRDALKQAAMLLAFLFIALGVLIALAYTVYLLYHKWVMDEQKREHARLDVQAKREQMRREQTHLHPDHLGNYPAIYDDKTSDVITIPSGNFMKPVPNHLHLESNYSDTSTRALPEGKEQQDVLANLHIPTFGENLASGDIGPEQKNMLFCYEVLQDEVTRKITGISPIRGAIQEQHTQLVIAGSGSGKTTYMASNMAQACVLGTLFYVIDPHKMHPEKSIAAKMKDFAPWFILPPASTHDEIRALLKHATKTRDAIIAGKPTPYDGYHIMVVVDEVPALMAYQKSTDKAIRQLYIDLALFMQSLGIQTAKFGITGLYGSQFAVKDTLGEIDFRDACMSTLIMRLHPIQAQALRTLGKENVNAIPKFPKGFGFLLLADDPETRRVASGNVSQQDLSRLAVMLPPSPLVKGVQTKFNDLSTYQQSSSVIPIREGVLTQVESSLTEVQTKFRNKIESPLQAKLDEMGIPEAYIMLKVKRVTEMLGQDKKIIMQAVWGVYPNKSDTYKAAEAEYNIVMEIIRYQAQTRKEREV